MVVSPPRSQRDLANGQLHSCRNTEGSGTCLDSPDISASPVAPLPCHSHDVRSGASQARLLGRPTEFASRPACPHPSPHSAQKSPVCALNDRHRSGQGILWRDHGHRDGPRSNVRRLPVILRCLAEGSMMRILKGVRSVKEGAVLPGSVAWPGEPLEPGSPYGSSNGGSRREVEGGSRIRTAQGVHRDGVRDGFLPKCGCKWWFEGSTGRKEE